jgi:hypothetical protein
MAALQYVGIQSLIKRGQPKTWRISRWTFFVQRDILLTETVITKSTRKESAARSIGDFGPGMNGWQNEIQVKITLDARSITKKNLPDRGYDAGPWTWFCSSFLIRTPDIQEAQQGHLDGRLAIRWDSIILDQERTAADSQRLGGYRAGRFSWDVELDDTAAARRHGHL